MGLTAGRLADCQAMPLGREKGIDGVGSSASIRPKWREVGRSGEPAGCTGAPANLPPSRSEA